PDCGEFTTAIVCCVPEVQLRLQGDTHPTLSTLRLNPTGTEVTVIELEPALKAAETERGALMVTLWGVVVPVRSPLNPENVKPRLAVALTGTIVPLLYQALAGLIVPPVPALVVKKYCVVKLAV